MVPHKWNADGSCDLNVSYTEIEKLNKMMLELNIPHSYERMFDGWQISYPNKDNLIADVIQHFGSYGAEENLLEIMGLLTKNEEKNDSVLGHLTAENCLNRFKKHYKSTIKTNCPNCGSVLVNGKCDYCNTKVR